MKRIFPLTAIISILTLSTKADELVKPIKALLIIGGCCHDYATQKEILKAGIEARANIAVDVCYSAKKDTTPDLACYKNAQWADGYDVIIHDECAADIKDLLTVQRMLEPHRKGIPGVNLHCAAHSYRISPEFAKPIATGSEGAIWFDYLGLQSSGHGKQLPISITYIDSSSPITKNFDNWTTVNEELYNNIDIRESAAPLAHGKQGESETVVVWTNRYSDKKTRVFSTTLGHNNETVADARYLDLVTRGLLWSCDKIDHDGKPLTGYGPAK